MQKTSYTPGPWFVKENMPHGGGIGIGPDYDDSGDSPHAIITFNGGESEANARLIAAAPAMFELLRDMLGDPTDKENETNVGDYWKKEIEKVLENIL
jgi:hypothetical protein